MGAKRQGGRTIPPLTANRLRKHLRNVHVVLVSNVDGLFAGLPPRILDTLLVMHPIRSNLRYELAVQHFFSLFHILQVVHGRRFISNVVECAVGKSEEQQNECTTKPHFLQIGNSE